MTIEERQRKFADFEAFAGEAEGIFTKLADADPSHQQLVEPFQFYVSPGGVTGVDRKLVQIHYGQRAVDVSESLDENLRPMVRLEAEVGAGLLYKRTANGGVKCLLYPARTESKPIDEEMLLLKQLDDPTKLRRKARKHWRALVAFMHCTSLDGEPTRTQRFRTWHLRCFRARYVDGTRKRSRATSLLLCLGKYTLTVGLSGFVILLVTWMLSCGVEDRQQAQFEAIQEQFSQVGARMQDVLAELQVQSQLMREPDSASMAPHPIIGKEEKSLTPSTRATLQDSALDELRGTHGTVNGSLQPKEEGSD